MEFTHTTLQSSNLSHDEWLANLFSSGLPSPELPADFPLAIRRVLTSQFPTSLSSMLESSGWAIDLGQASLELMFLSSLCCQGHSHPKLSAPLRGSNRPLLASTELAW